MDVSAEAKRVMVQALSKMYSSRSQRGGLRLHRSLLLSLVMRSARDIYHAARGSEDCQESPKAQEESMDTSSPDVPDIVPDVPPHSTTHETQDPQPGGDQENRDPARADRQSRKRRGKRATEPDFLPCKRAKLDSGEVLRVLQDATLRNNAGSCARETDILPNTLPNTLPSTVFIRTVATC